MNNGNYLPYPLMGFTNEDNIISHLPKPLMFL
jgi:hypothetical protein